MDPSDCLRLRLRETNIHTRETPAKLSTKSSRRTHYSQETRARSHGDVKRRTEITRDKLHHFVGDCFLKVLVTIHSDGSDFELSNLVRCRPMQFTYRAGEGSYTTTAIDIDTVT